MKSKRFFFALLALVLAFSLLPAIGVRAEGAEDDVAINSTNFPDENFRTLVYNSFDANRDGKLSASEIETVKTINAQGKNISSVKGVEHFTALTNLSCSKNQLTELDISKCKGLTSLDCGDNRLSNLDVSSCTALTSLDCHGNWLTELNMSGCTALEEIRCYSNQLTSLDISECTALRYLSCGNNQMTSLDVSGCTTLTTLYCSSSCMTSLNVSGCQALTMLNCTDSALTTLDVSGCQALEALHCTGSALVSLNANDCKALRVLHCTDCALTSLDVRGCTALTTLYCYSNQLTSLDVNSCTALKELRCYNNQLASLDVSGCTALTQLRCFNNRLALLNVSGCTALEEIRCYSNQLTSLDVSKCTALTYLGCHDNALTMLDVSGECRALWFLGCQDNALTTLDASNNKSLRYLRCFNNQLTELDVGDNTSLTSLDCSTNALTALDVRKNTALVALTCYSNRISFLDISVCRHLADAYSKGTKTEMTADNGLIYWQYSSGNNALQIDTTTEIKAELAKPAITAQPAAQSVAAGKPAVFTVKASGEELSYQWWYRTSSDGSWTKVKTNGTSATYSLTTAARHNGYQYRCRVSNAAGGVWSKTVTLTVVSKPTITTQPTAQTVAVGKTASFKVAASGTGLSYQWQYKKPGETSWTNVSTNGTSATYSLTTAARHDGYTYRCRVKNSAGSVYSGSAKLTVVTAKPTITTQPKAVSVTAGKTASFKVAAEGTALSYQWQYKKPGGTWTNVSTNGTSATYTLTTAARHNGYLYRCKVTNAMGSVYTTSVKLTVK